MTAEKFVPHPFSEEDGARLYRTGDVCRYLEDGKIEFLGRVDGQVKVRGYRIELSEIEAALNEHSSVRQSVVIAREDERGGKRLLGYVVGEEEATVAELKRHLRKRLPEYMVPETILFLDEMPLLLSGKIDRDRLPNSDRAYFASNVTYIAPRTELEHAIAAVWEELLQVKQVSIHDNFFDLGAHSLMMAQVASKLRDIIQRELPVITLFQYPTISALAEYLAQEGADISVPQMGGDFVGVHVDNVFARDENESRRSLTRVYGITRSDSHSTARLKRPSDIAIIGMSGRFPQAPTIDDFWRNLCDAREAVISFSDSQLLAAGVAPHLLADPRYVKAGTYLDGIDLFDASFFDINPREAEILDPQQRLFLQSAWHALESAGYVPERFPGLIGLFAGAGASHYFFTVLLSNPDLLAIVGAFQVGIANDKDFLPTRVSYKLNLRGPSVAVQTACSTSLVAVHLACQSLLLGECDIALAGGVSIAISQGAGYLYREGDISSSDGHCRAFDAHASGAIGGSGLGIVALKRLADARADGDNILAVIKGSAVNNDGSSKVGYTAPSIDGQARVIAEAQAIAGVDPATITYVEAHGTGTALGDPIEVAALTQTFRAATDKSGFCAIGSVKTNVGHLDAAAGVTGLIKTVLALKHRQIPASLNFEQPNPQIDFARSPFYVNTELRQWENNGVPRRAGVSSFGIGGTNAHLVLEEAPKVEPSEVAEGWQLLVLSARSDSALTKMTARLAAYLKQHPELNLADVAYTLQEGRKAFAHRLFVVCRDLSEAIAVLEERDSPRHSYRAVAGERATSVVYMFPGQGVQYVGMGRELYEQEPEYRSVIDRCAEIAAEELEIDLRRALYPNPEGGAEEEAQAVDLINQTHITQVALFAVELGLARVWQRKGVQPTAMIGHSLGEYVAGCLAGVMSEEQAIKLVAKRGALMREATSGAMLAVSTGENEMREQLRKAGSRLEVAAINGPQQCVVSGEPEAITELKRRLDEAGIGSKRLKTSHAFHSWMMEKVAGKYEREVGKVELKKPTIRYISNLSGKWISAEEAQDSNYWGRQMRAPVRYWEGLQQIGREIKERVLLEVGPGKTLSQLGRKLNGEGRQGVVETLGEEAEGGVRAVVEAVGKLWAHGVEIEWKKWRKGSRRRVELPGYPFDEERYWVEEVKERARVGVDKRRKALGEWFYAPIWREAAVMTNSGEAKEARRWLILADEVGIGDRIAAGLEQQGCAVTRVKKGARYERRGDREYWIRVGEADDYKALLGELNERGEWPEKIVHLFSLSQREDGKTSGWEDQIDEAAKAGFYSLVYLAQGIGQRKGADEVEVMVVSNGVAELVGDEEMKTEKATLIGPIKAMRQEYPHVMSRYIDVIVPPSGSRQEDRLVSQLIKDLNTTSVDLVTAYRGNYRWAQTYEARPIAPAPIGKGLRPTGVYLITGGLGGIGMALAEYLAHTVRARLVLTGREGLPERSEWDWLVGQTAVHEDIRWKIHKIRELEEMGAEIEVIKADVSKENEMREVVRRTQRRFGPINGVIHAAGIVGEQSITPIKDITLSNSSLLFRPKVHGLFVLEKIFQHADLDFCLLFSSLSSVLGGWGFAAYSGSNIFMDTFVRNHNRISTVPWISINWDGWQLTRDDNHKGAGPGLIGADFAIKPAEGVEAFQRIISMNIGGQVIVSTTNLQSRIDRWINIGSQGSEQRRKRPVPISGHSRRELQTAYVAPRNDLEQSIAAIWQNLLGIEQIGIHDDYFELGGNSLLAIQYLSNLRYTFDVEIPIRSIFEKSTIAEQGKIIEEALIEEIEGLPEEEVSSLRKEK
jgi:acyl transferase domain-containing protein/acyl carrier protein